MRTDGHTDMVSSMCVHFMRFLQGKLNNTIKGYTSISKQIITNVIGTRNAYSRTTGVMILKILVFIERLQGISLTDN
jgi:hypothetical protein